MPGKYDQETKAKAIRLVREHAGDYPTVCVPRMSSVAVSSEVAMWMTRP